MNDVSKSNNQPNTMPCSARSDCAIANGLEVLGDRWTLLIIRDLMFTNRNEFGHLVNSNEGISTNILTERLKRLQQFGVIEKQTHPSHGKKFIYRLTERGLALAPVIIELAIWSFQTIEGTFIPDEIKQLMLTDRNLVYQKVNAREPLIMLDL